MDSSEQVYVCAECGSILDHPRDEGETPLCHECGSTSRRMAVNITTVDIKEKVKFKAKPSGRTGKPELEIKMDDEFYKEKKEWRKIKMVVDRGHDYYEKSVVDPKTGETVYRVEKPLRSHIGHGSAKHKKKNKGKD